jgi:hypothetical protein
MMYRMCHGLSKIRHYLYQWRKIVSSCISHHNLKLWRSRLFHHKRIRTMTFFYRHWLVVSPLISPPGPDPSHVVEFGSCPLVVTCGWWVHSYNRSYSAQFGFLTGSAHFVFWPFLTMQYFHNGPIMYFMDNGKEACPDFGPFIVLTNAILNNWK